MSNPYNHQPPRAFWRSGVADVSPLELDDLYRPRFPIPRQARIATAGSCFAQHIGRQLKRRGYAFLDLEPPPEGLPPSEHERFGLDLYSARYGNVYTIRQLVQLFERAEGRFHPQEGAWTAEGRVYDPFRPSVAPGGFASRGEMELDRAYHLRQVARLLERTDVFVFTFGLTEGWICTSDGAALPACPGTIAGEFDPARHAFHNFTFGEILADAERFIALALSKNPAMKFLFTVSPVPLTATATGEHVLAATVYSKSVLRAVCGELRERHAAVDYFPSYELVASHPMRAMFYQPNLRGVSLRGVDHVMRAFFAAHGDAEPAAAGAPPRKSADDVVCEEQILEVFGR